MKNIIQQFKDFLSEIGISVKHASLLLIALISLFLIIIGAKGFDFGVVALACWILAFLDLARIKLRDFEIDFMGYKQTLTADERKLFLDNYNLVMTFITEYIMNGYITKEALDFIQRAFNDAQLNLPDEIVTYTKTWATKARDAFVLHCRWENLPVGDKRSKLIDEEYKITKEILKMDPAKLYRKYIKVGENNAE